MRMQITAVIPRNSFVLNAGSSQTSVQHVAPLKIPPNQQQPFFVPTFPSLHLPKEATNDSTVTALRDETTPTSMLLQRKVDSTEPAEQMDGLPGSQQASQEGNRCTASPHSSTAPPTSPCHLPHDSTNPEKE